jgi:hypothetical protein
MIVTREEADGYATCDADRVQLGRCEGYDSRPCRVIVETVAFLYGDYNAASSDPVDGILADRVEHSVERLHPVDPDDAVCRFCGGPVNFSLELRTTVARANQRRR